MTLKGPFQLRQFYDSDSVIGTMGFKISENAVGKKVDKVSATGDLTWEAESRLQYRGG